MKSNHTKIAVIFFIFLITLLITACEDPVPTDYKAENFVQAYLIVDEPIRNIDIMKTQPLTDTFSYKNSLIRDADVVITGDGQEFHLVIDADSEHGYYYSDSNYLVKPSTEYKLEVHLQDGKILTGSTTTPGRTGWVRKSPNPLQYPEDTLKLPATDTIVWRHAEGIYQYLIQVRCLDTLEYGSLYSGGNPDEKNRRIYFHWTREEDFKDLSNWALIFNTQSSIVWAIFKWFGMHEVTIYAPDPNFMNWMKQIVFTNEYDPRYSTIKGGIGVFGSASTARDTIFIVKNQE